MLKSSLKDLDFAKLIKEARHTKSSVCQKQIKIALLADCASQHLTSLLKVLLAKNGVAAEIFESEYDTIEQEIINPESRLYQFQPQFIILVHSVWALRSRFYGSRQEPAAFVDSETAKLGHLWNTIQTHSKTSIIQSNFVLPYERLFGNFDLVTNRSFAACGRKINAYIQDAACKEPNVFVSDLDYLASYVGRKHWFDEKMWIMAKALCAYEYLPLAAQNIVDIVLAQLGSGVKCMILDLDNTLWGGIIGDDGLEGIRLGHLNDGEAFESFQYFLRDLKNRGIILAVVSKNERENALLPFQKHPDMILKEEDIAVFIANWQNKAENIKQVREILNIGFDSMVFLDDNPFERKIVKEQIPDLIIPELPEDPAEYVKAITELNLFETSVVSDTDKDRTLMYREEANRRLTEEQFSDPRDYLKSLGLKITIGRFDDFHLPRIIQLMQRSNQFNLMTQRFNEAQCREMMNDAKHFFPFYVCLKDKFGDNGLISTVVLKWDDAECLHIVEWLMSCRVLARGVEQYMMNYVFEYAAQNGFGRVLGYFRKTAKNQMVQNFYAQFGFDQFPMNENEAHWRLNVNEYVPKEHFIELEGHSVKIPNLCHSGESRNPREWMPAKSMPA